MILVEMAFKGQGGLESLVLQASRSVEEALEGLGLHWRADYPVTLHESLRLGLQQQIMGGRAPRAIRQDADPPIYRVWIGLPEGGLRAWTDGLVQRVLDGCAVEALPGGDQARKRLQSTLVQALGPCLQQASVSEALAG